MDRNEIFILLKSLIVKSSLNIDPTLSHEKLLEIARQVEEKVKLDTPISAIGLDSMEMTWLLVNFEEKLQIDASNVSFFELYDVNDLIDRIHQLIGDQTVGTHA